MAGPIRLACISCDRDDHDGITELPEDWEDIDQIDPLSLDPSDWYTHLGWCPDCLKLADQFAEAMGGDGDGDA